MQILNWGSSCRWRCRFQTLYSDCVWDKTRKICFVVTELYDCGQVVASHHSPVGGALTGKLPSDMLSPLLSVPEGGVEPIAELAGDGDQLELPQEATKFIKKKQPSKKVKKGRSSYPVTPPPTLQPLWRCGWWHESGRNLQVPDNEAPPIIWNLQVLVRSSHWERLLPGLFPSLWSHFMWFQQSLFSNTCCLFVFMVK